jgi:ribosome-associated protein
MSRLLTEHFIRSPGPGGQNVNKVATGVELRFDVARAELEEEVKARLRALAGSRMTAGDVLVIQAHEHRSQSKNREAARARLDQLIARAVRRPRTRRPTAPPPVARERRVRAKKTRGALKQSRSRKPRAGDED